MIFGLHHGLKEISQFGRSVKRLDQQEQFGRLDPVVSGALNQFGDDEQSGKKRLDHRVERQRRNRISGDDRILRCRSTENIPLAKTETARQRQHHGTVPSSCPVREKGSPQGRQAHCFEVINRTGSFARSNFSDPDRTNTRRTIRSGLNRRPSPTCRNDRRAKRQ